MSHSKSDHSGKSLTTSSPTIAFRFRSGDDELEELQIEHDKNGLVEAKVGSDNDPGFLSVEDDKCESTSETTPVKEYWNLLGKRSTSVDSGCDSSFPNSDPWRKFNELKGKLTKTVEEKISEIKIERNKSGNVLGISTSRGRLVNSSKDNSSISDSEDTSESSRLSESLKESEENFSPKRKAHHKSETVAGGGGLFDSVLENVKPEIVEKIRDDKTGHHGRLTDIVKLSEIKISTAKTESQENAIQRGEVESGIEADENFTSDKRQEEGVDNTDLSPDGTGSSEHDYSQNRSTRSESPQSGSGRRWLPPPFENIQIFSLASILIGKKTELMALAAAMILYHIFPLSPFLKGLVTGIVVMCIGNYIYAYVSNLGFTSREDYMPDGPFKIPIYELLKPLTVPRQTVSTTNKGVWFNEYVKEYDPDMYSVTQTVPVYLEVNDCYLKLSRPKGKINKRATYDEPEYKLVFVNHRLYNISGCTVLLLPDGLTKKRLYSKKYPIVIVLKPDSLVTEKAKDKDLVVTLDEEETDPENTETDETLSQSQESAYGRLYLNLFARCDRQKEEWYRKLLAATKMKVTPDKSEKQNWSIDFENIEEVESNLDESSASNEPSTPFESVHFDQEEATYEEYLRYMTQFLELQIPNPETYSLKTLKVPGSIFKRLKKQKKKASNEVSNGPVRSLPTRGSLPQSQGPRKLSASMSWPTRGKITVPEEETVGLDTSQSAEQTLWFNAFVNRILFDVFRSPYWLEQIRIKMEKKLNSIRMPYYVEDIEIVELDLGKMGPRFHRISPPVLDDRGLWFDMDMTFDGLVKVTIQTQLNLIKLQKGIEQSEQEEDILPPPDVQEKPEAVQASSSERKTKKKVKIKVEKNILWETEEAAFDKTVSPGSESIPPDSGTESFDKETKPGLPEIPEFRVDDEKCIAELVDIALDTDQEPENCSRSPMYDSELEDSAESSDEEEDEDDETSQSSTVETVSESVPTSQKKNVPMRKSSKKLFRIFENVAQSKYFKSVAQSKYVQKAIAGVSKTKLKLSLEIKGCVGTIAVNIPPPPSDRLWYGFREMPKVWLSAQPKIGEKHVRISHVKNFLEKKIMQEFKKVMVFPNMDDIILPTYPQGYNMNPTSSYTVSRQPISRSLVSDLIALAPSSTEMNET